MKTVKYAPTVSIPVVDAEVVKVAPRTHHYWFANERPTLTLTAEGESAVSSINRSEAQKARKAQDCNCGKKAKAKA